MRTQRSSSNLFVGPKCASAIPTRHPLVRDAVLQASFDPSVSQIEFVPSVQVGRHAVALNSVILTKDGRRFLLDVIDARPLRTLDDEGLVLLALERAGFETLQLSESTIRGEPRCSNAREIWRSRSYRLSSPQRSSILDILAERGPLSIAWLRNMFGKLDCREAVFALACEGAVQIDIDAVIGPATMVRLRSQISSTPASLDLPSCKSAVLR